MTGPDWRFTVVRERTINFSREQLLAMPQSLCLLVLLEGLPDRWSQPRQIAFAKLLVNRNPDEAPS